MYFKHTHTHIQTCRIAKAEGGSWARLRMFGSVGFGFGANLTGMFADRSSLGYGVAFLVSAALAVPTAALMTLLLSGKHKQQQQTSASNSSTAATQQSATKAAKAATSSTSSSTSSSNPLIATVQASWAQPLLVRLLWCSILISGASYGFLEVFLFPLLKSAGSSSSILGRIRGINAVSALPFYYFSSAIVRRCGVAGTLAAACLAYAARLFFHAAAATAGALPAPLTILAVECLYGITGGAMWSAAAAFAQALAPAGLGATMMGLLSALHFGIGMSLGSYIGGVASHRYTIYTIYCDYMHAHTLCIYFLNQYCILRSAQTRLLVVSVLYTT
jgi:MFS_1 like family